jgi:Flp pilus assembly protein TadG
MRKKLLSVQRGQTLVEFALILPAFLLLAVLIFDFGRAIYYYSAIHNAAREAARYGVIHPNVVDYPAIKTKAVNYAIGLGLTSADVSVGPGTPENAGGFANPTIKVTVQYKFRPATPLLAQFMPCACGYIKLSSDAVMRTESIPYP